MIFGRQLIGKVLSGEKTQTRRVVAPAHRTDHYRPRMERAVQSGRGKPGIARIRIVTVARAFVTAITAVDVAAEGFADRAAFARFWLQMHDPDPRMRAAVQRDPRQWDGITDESVLEHFTARHAARRVWVLEFELVTQAPPVLLAARPSTASSGRPFLSGRELGDQARRNARRRPYDPWPQTVDFERAEQLDAHGYTTEPANALRGEPEVMDARGTVASLEAQQAWVRDHAEISAEIRGLPLAVRVGNARRLAQDRHDNPALCDLRVVDRLVGGGRLNAAQRKMIAVEERLSTLGRRAA